jgi:hypothetical protein
MKFSSKIFASAALPAVLFVLGLFSSIGSHMNTQGEFDKYIRSEQTVERALSEMFAQGQPRGCVAAIRSAAGLVVVAHPAQ